MKQIATALSVMVAALAAMMLVSPMDSFAQRDRQDRQRGENVRNEKRGNRAERPRITNTRPRIARQASSSQGVSGQGEQSHRRFQWGRVRQKEDRPARAERSDRNDRSRSVTSAKVRNREPRVNKERRREPDLKRAQRRAHSRARDNRRALARRSNQFPSAGHNFNAQRRYADRHYRRSQRNDFTRELGRINRMLYDRGYRIPRRFQHSPWVADAARIYDRRRARYLNGVDLGPIYYVIQRYGLGPHLVDNYVEYCSSQGLTLADIFLGIQAIVSIVEQFKGCLPAVACVPPQPVPAGIPAAACPLPPPPPPLLPRPPLCLPPLPLPPPLPGFCPFP